MKNVFKIKPCKQKYEQDKKVSNFSKHDDKQGPVDVTKGRTTVETSVDSWQEARIFSNLKIHKNSVAHPVLHSIDTVGIRSIPLVRYLEARHPPILNIEVKKW